MPYIVPGNPANTKVKRKMKVETIVDMLAENKILMKNAVGTIPTSIAVIRLVPENGQETEFLKKAFQEGLRVFEASSSGGIGMALPSEANLKQIHIPERMKSEEAKIRREGFPITREDAKALLNFIKTYNPSHDAIEPEIVVKLELLAGIIHIQESEGTS